MGRKSFDQLKRHIVQALGAIPKEVQQDPADPVNIRPGWPSVGEDKIAASIAAELGALEKSQRELIRRMKAFSYPYPERTDIYPPGDTMKAQKGSKPRRTFFSTLKSRGLLDLFLNPPLIWEIRRAWLFNGYYEFEKELRTGRLSQHRYELAVHQKMMVEISEHLEKMSKIVENRKNHPVSDNWLAEYRTASQKQLLREASAYYPELLRWFKPANQIRPHSHKVDVQVELFQAIEAVFAKRKVRDHKLARQLTALVCSPQECVRTGKLDPNPALVYRNIRDRKKPKNK